MSEHKTPKIKVGITHGDLNGIGYEVIIKALEDPMMTDLCTPVLYGSGKIAGYYRRGMNLPQTPIKHSRKGSRSQRRCREPHKRWWPKIRE